MSRTSAVLRDGIILNNRYRIVKQIGRGGFGRAYLAEDTHRYRELCVLKEFAPQVESDRELNKAEDLFEREAGILYKLKHRQIPKFEALLQTRVDGKRSLFLVQEYIEGEDYWELLTRKGRLSEAEVTNMMWDLLPVLDYIHASKLVHRDISPDNLIRRESDGKTVLIDFGCVKIAANAISRSTGQSVTLIGKKGYSPDEQTLLGHAFPCSDLYSLAATAVVLLTGKQPSQLYNSYQGKWQWESKAKVSPNLKKVLNKMLAKKPSDRYQSADRVLQVLTKENDSPVSSFISRVRTLIVAPENSDDFDSNSSGSFRSRSYSNISRIATKAIAISRYFSRIPFTVDLKRIKPWHWGMISAGVFLIPGLLSFATIKTKMSQTVAFNSNNSNNVEHSVLSQSERDLQQEIYQRIKSLNLDASAFYKEVDSVFHAQHPELKRLQLTEGLKDRAYRQMWYKIASNLLNKKERSRQ